MGVRVGVGLGVGVGVRVRVRVRLRVRVRDRVRARVDRAEVHAPPVAPWPVHAVRGPTHLQLHLWLRTEYLLVSRTGVLVGSPEGATHR